MQPLHVCVIGAGAAGLCAARHLAARPDIFSFHLFEQTSNLGGTWVYCDSTGRDQHGLPIHSSMYKNLRTNVPKEIMSFLDYPFPESEESYIHHTAVLQYLIDYAQHYGVYEHIQFQTVVKLVTPITSEEKTTAWSVTVQNLKTKKETTSTYDVVMVCNGHYAVPTVPDLRGIESFQGQVLHSHEYRQAAGLEGLQVMVLGAASSGLDICLEIAHVAHQIYLSHNLSEPIVSELPDNVKQVPCIASVFENVFTLQDGTSVKADVLIYCTGYKFDFPFLTPECGVRLRGRRVKPLYKHMIHTNLPSMAFVGIPFIVLPFPLFDYQVQYFLKTLDGSVQLPGKEEMEEDAERDFRMRLELQMPPRYAHKLGCLQWEYMKDLAEQTGIPPLSEAVKGVYDKSSYRRKYHLMQYKTDSYSAMFNKRQDIVS